MVYDILITHIKGLVQVRDYSLRKVAGKEMANLPILEDAFLIISQGLIHSFGLMKELPSSVNAHTIIDATG